MGIFAQATQPLIYYSTFVNAGTFNGPQYNSSVGQGYEWHAQVESLIQKQGHLESLRHQTLPSALHDSREHHGRPTCHLNTRIDVLGAVDRWAVDPDCFQRAPCFLLSGALGTGKTAIAQTMADKWDLQHRLAASFFLPPAGHRDAARIIPTVAYQLALAFPQLSSPIEQVIAEDPFVFDKSLAVQMAQLIVRPFREASWADSSSKSMIVIDGLDGTFQDEQEILALFVEALCADISLPFIILLTCRSGPPIIPILEKINPFREVVLVELDGLSSSADIELFIRSRLQQIKGSKDCHAWPPTEAVEKLVEKASGQFMYASSVVDYICSPFDHPECRLQFILGERTGGFTDHKSPFTTLDSRYQCILQAIGTPPGIVMEILAWLLFYGGEKIVPPTTIYPGEPIPLTSPTGLEQMLALEPDSIHDCLAGWHSILEIPPREHRLHPIRIRHPSFIDFLADESRSKEFFIDRRGASAWIVRSLLRNIMTHRISNLELTLPPYQPMIREDAFVYHLRNARPTIELKDRLEDILGFNGEGCHQMQNTFSKMLLVRQTAPLSPLSRDTGQAIIYFLQKCNDELETRFIRWLISRHRLAFNHFLNIFRTLSCSWKDTFYHMGCSIIHSSSAYINGIDNIEACQNIFRVSFTQPGFLHVFVSLAFSLFLLLCFTQLQYFVLSPS